MEIIAKPEKKKKEHLHVPSQYVPLCKNFHPEKETLRGHLRTKSIDRTMKFHLLKPDSPATTPKPSPKIFSYDNINKKKTKEIISTYSLNAKMKLQRKLMQDQEEWKKNEHKRNSLKLFGVGVTEEEIDSKQKTIKSPIINQKPEEVLQNSKLKSLVAYQKMPLETPKTNKYIDLLNKQIEKVKIQRSIPEIGEKCGSSYQRGQRLSTIEKTEVKIFGENKFNKDKIRQIFKNSQKNATKPKKNNKKRKMKSLLSEPDLQKFTIPSLPGAKSRESIIQNEHLKTDAYTIWKYNCLTDDFQINADEKDDFFFNILDKNNLRQFLSFKKKETFALAAKKIEIYKQFSEQNQKEIQRSRTFLSNMRSGEGLDGETSDDEEVGKNDEIRKFNDPGERNSLPAIFLSNKKDDPELQVKSLAEALEKSQSKPFLKLAQSIEGICKNEHKQHLAFVKNFKTENRLVQRKFRKIKQIFENLH